MSRRAITLLVALLALAATAMPAHAGTVELRYVGSFVIPPEPKGGSSGGMGQTYELVLKSAPGEASDMTVSALSTGGGVAITDTGAPLTAGQNCTKVGTEVRCSTTAGFTSISQRTFDLGDGDDKIRVSGTGGAINLGPGNDTLSVDQPINGGLPTTVDGGIGADTFTGNRRGIITATYGTRAAPVTATLDGVANDGEAGEGDQLGFGVGNVTGGEGADTLTGDQHENRLSGRGGKDTLNGLGARDDLNGDGGNDDLSGGEGNEFFTADAGADTIRGGGGEDGMNYRRYGDPTGVTVTLDDQPGDGKPGENDNILSDVENLRGGEGDDRLIGNDGANSLEASDGNDFLDGRGGEDFLYGYLRSVKTMVGGAGRDRFATVGYSDTVRAADGEADIIDCGARGIASIEGDPIDRGEGCIGGIDIPNDRKRIAVSRRGAARIDLVCLGAEESCSGRITLLAADRRTRRRAGRVLGRVRAAIDTSGRVRIRLSRRAVRYLRTRRRALRVTASLSSSRSLPAETRRRSETVRLVARRR